MNTAWHRSLVLICIAWAGTLTAQVDTWDGGGADNNLSTGLNWVDNGAPLGNLAATDLVFGGSVRPSPNLSTNFSANAVTFNSTATAFTVTGNALTIGAGGIRNNDGDLQTFNNGITVGNATITSSAFTAASGNLLFNGTVALGTSTLAVNGTQTVTLANLTGTGTINKTSSGTLNYGVTGPQTQGWDLVVSTGTVNTNATTNLTIGSTGSVLLSGGNYNANGNLTVSGGTLQRTSGSLSLNGQQLRVEAAGNLTTNSLDFANKTLTVTGTGSRLFTSSAQDYSGNTSIQVLAGGNLTAGFFMDIATTTGSNVTVTVNGSGSQLNSLASGPSFWGGGNASIIFSNSGVGSLLGGIDLATFGSNSTGSLSLLSGGLTVGHLRVASTVATTNGIVTVDGDFSLLIAANMTIGAASLSSATVNIINSADVSVTGNAVIRQTGNLNIDNLGGSFSAVNLTVDGGRVTDLSGSSIFGFDGLRISQTLIVQNGGDLIQQGVTPLEVAWVDWLVTGAGSTLTSNGLFVGLGLNLDVLNGGAVSTGNGSVILGDESFFPGGSLLVDGAGSSLSGGSLLLRDTLQAVGAASAALLFRNQATGTFAQIEIANSANRTGSTANLIVAGGADVTGTALVIANAPSLGQSVGNLTIEGAGSTFTVQGNGTTVIGGSVNSTATLTVKDGGIFTSGTGNSTLNATGTINLNGGTMNFLGQFVRNGGTLNFNTGNLAMINNLVVGTGGLLGANLTLVASQTFSTTGNTSVEAARTLTLSGGNLSTNVLTNAGAVNLLAGTLTTQSIVNNGTLTLNGGTLSTGTFANNSTLSFLAGTLAVTGPGGLTVGTGGLLGTSVQLGSGSHLQVTNGTTTLQSGATLSVNGGSFATANLNNSGTLRALLGTTTLGNATNTATGRVFVAETIAINGTFTNQAAGRVTLQDGSGQLLGNGTLVNNGLVTGDGQIATGFTNNAGGEIRAEAGKTLTFTGNQIGANSGQINLLGGTLEFLKPITNGGLGQINGHGSLYVPDSPVPSSGNSSAGLNNNGNLSFSGGAMDIFGTVSMNPGSRLITTGGSVATFYDVFRHNGADVKASAGSSIVFFSEVRGAGNFTGTGTIYMEGGYNPGNSPGAVTIDTNLVFGDAFTLTLEIGGTAPGTEYDQLLLTGNASLVLNGTLVIDLINGYTPEAGDTFDLLAFGNGQITGNFDQIVFANSGAQFDTSQLLSSGTVQFQGIPEPATAALLLGGFTAALLPRRRSA